jgi:acyl carrier protein
VNLNQLSDTGMAVDFMAKMISPPAIHSDSITSTELPLLFDVMFTHFEQQNIAISRGSLNETIEANFMCSASSAEYISEPTTTFVIVDTDYSTNEFKVAGLFCDILGVSEISLNDDFFKLGGNSMAAIKLSHQLEKVLSIPVDITDVFKFTTIKELAGNLTVNEPITNNEVWEL